LTFVPGCQRDHDRVFRCEVFRKDLIVARLLPLPNANGGTQVLTGVLWIRRPVVVGELDAAAIGETALRKVELESDVPQFCRLDRLRLRKYMREQSAGAAECRGRMAGRRTLHFLVVTAEEFLGNRHGVRCERFRSNPRREVPHANAVSPAATR